MKWNARKSTIVKASLFSILLYFSVNPATRHLDSEPSKRRSLSPLHISSQSLITENFISDPVEDVVEATIVVPVINASDDSSLLKQETETAALTKKTLKKLANPNLLMEARLRHAKELLGKHYKHSVVRFGEKIPDMKKFVRSQVATELGGKWKKQARQVAQAIMRESSHYHFDPIFMVAVIENESSFNPVAVGTSGEIGLMQIRAGTAKWIAGKYHIPWKGEDSLKQPITNIRIGAAYLDYLRAQFDFQGGLYLAAYNMGSSKLQRALDNHLHPKGYATRVMQRYIRIYTELRTSTGRAS